MSLIFGCCKRDYCKGIEKDCHVQRFNKIFQRKFFDCINSSTPLNLSDRGGHYDLHCSILLEFPVPLFMQYFPNFFCKVLGVERFLNEGSFTLKDTHLGSDVVSITGNINNF